MAGILERINGWVSHLLSSDDAHGYPPWDSFWYGDIGTQTRAGVDVNEDTALTYSACWAATRLLSSSGSVLPFNLYRRVGGGGKEIAYDHPVHSLLHDAPNAEMSAMMWRSQGIASQVNRGNCYSEIMRDPLGRVSALWPLHASRVRPCRDLKGNLLYEVRMNGQRPPVHLEARDVFHVPSMMSDDGINGKGVVEYARETIGSALSRERFSATFFGNGARPGIVVTHPNKMSPEARRNFRQEWAEIHQGPENANKLALLQEGASIKEFGFNLEESQFIEGNQWGIEDVARWYGVPPHMIGHLLRATFNNIEHMGMEFVTYSLIPWLKLWEQEVWRKLLTPSERKVYYAKHVVDALLRGDVASRTAASVQQVFNGLLTINQWAEREDLNPVGPAGDIHWVQAAMMPLEIAAKGPQPVAAEPDDSDDAPGELLDLPDYRQALPYDCGACCTQIVADHFGIGDGRTEADYVAELGATPENGTEPEAIVDWFNDRGCVTTSGPGMTLDDLREFCRANQPVIVPVQMYGVTPEYDAEEALNQSGHYVVVRGVELGCVFLQDPIAGRVEMEESEFDKRWHDREGDGTKDGHFGIAVRQRVSAKVKPMPEPEGESETEAETPPVDAESPPATDAPPEPVESSDAAASVGTVQDTALNGAQVTALIAIVTAVAQKEMPPATGKAALRASYPLMDVALIDAMIDPLDGFEAPKPAPPPAPFGGPPASDPPPDSEDTPTPDADLSAQRGALRALLVDTLGRMLRKESNAVRRAAAKPGELFAWMDDFYPRHQETLSEALAPVVQACHAMYQDTLPVGDAVARWVEQSRADLLTAAEVPAEQFVAAVEEMLSRWEGRPAAMAEAIIGG